MKNVKVIENDKFTVNIDLDTSISDELAKALSECPAGVEVSAIEMKVYYELPDDAN